MKLSAFFSLEELAFSEWAERHGIDNTPPSELLPNLRRLAYTLDEVRVLLGRPVHVNSGYRCAQANEGVGSKAKHSRHLDGLAADIVSREYGTPIQICEAIAASEIEFDQLIYEHTWVHFGLAPEGWDPRRQILTLMPDGSYAPGIVEQAAQT